MNTTTPRARAGQPYMPPFQLHRAMPIDFVLPDEEQEIRNGFDQAMKAPISKAAPDIDSTRQYPSEPEGVDWFGYLLIACLLCVIFSGLGYLAGRYFS